MSYKHKGKIIITELSNLNLLLRLKEKNEIINTTSFQIFISSKNAYEIKLQQISNDQLFQGQVQLSEKTIDHIILNIKDLSIKQHNIISIQIPIDQEQVINSEVVVQLNQNSIERLMFLQNTFEINQILDNILGIQSQFRGRLTARKPPIQDETIGLIKLQLKVEEQLTSQIREFENTEQQFQQFKEFINNSNDSQQLEKKSLLNCLVQHDQTIMKILESQWKNAANLFSHKKIESIGKYTNNIEKLRNEIQIIDLQITDLQQQFNFEKRQKKTIQLELKNQILERLTYKYNYLQQITPLVVNRIALLTSMNTELVICERYFQQNYDQNQTISNKEQLETIQYWKTQNQEKFEKTNHFLETLNFNNDLKLQQQIEIFKKQEKENQINKAKLEQKIQSLQDELEQQKNRAKDLENSLQSLYQYITQIEAQNKQLQQNNQNNLDNLILQQNEIDQYKSNLKLAEEEVTSLKYQLQSKQVNQLQKQQYIENDNAITKTKLEQKILSLQVELEQQKNRAKDLENILKSLDQQIEAQNKQLEQNSQNNQDKLILTNNQVDQFKSKLKVAEDEVASLKYQLQLQKEQKIENDKTITKTKLEQKIQLVQDELEIYEEKENDLVNILKRLKQYITNIDSEYEQLSRIIKNNQDKVAQSLKYLKKLPEYKKIENDNERNKNKLEQTIQLLLDEVKKYKTSLEYQRQLIQNDLATL